MKPSKDYANIHRRAIAYLIDSLLVYVVFILIIQSFVFVPLRNRIFISDDWFRSGWNTEAYTLLTISLPTWLYFALCEISPWKATLGKRLLKLQTLDKTSKHRITLKQAILRTVIKMLPWEVAHLTNNLPTPMWYDPNPGFRIGFMVVPILITLYGTLALVTQHRQSLHDLAAKTVVVIRKD